MNRRIVAVLGLLTLCLPAGAPAFAHEDREPRLEREDRETRAEREDRSGERVDNSGPGSRDDRSGSDDHLGGDRSGSSRDGSNPGSDSSGSGSSNKGSGRSGGERGGDRQRSGPRIEFERDHRGAERVRGEVLVVGNVADVAKVRAAGLTVIEETRLAALDAQLARVRVPEGRDIDGVLDELRRLVPGASVAADHVFRPSTGGTTTAGSTDAAETPFPAATVGVVDTGIDPVTPALRSALVATRGFANGGYVPRDHGTAVGDIAARAGVSLLSADVFGLDSGNSLAATTLALAQSLDWMLTSGVRVINISIEGPDNPVLARLVSRAVAADVAIVAAAGNDGPAAPPAYPAAYPGVIAVTAVDERGYVYRRANRGSYVSFAARGVGVAVPGRDGSRRESGTSFAAPVVAAALALRRGSRPQDPVAACVGSLAQGARDLGAKGRDEIYGWGEIVAGPPASARN